VTWNPQPCPQCGQSLCGLDVTLDVESLDVSPFDVTACWGQLDVTTGECWPAENDHDFTLLHVRCHVRQHRAARNLLRGAAPERFTVLDAPVPPAVRDFFDRKLLALAMPKLASKFRMTSTPRRSNTIIFRRIKPPGANSA
jgi:hypothetical protein